MCMCVNVLCFFFFFFFNDTATTEIYTLSLHDALPIWIASGSKARPCPRPPRQRPPAVRAGDPGMPRASDVWPGPGAGTPRAAKDLPDKAAPWPVVHQDRASSPGTLQL